MTATDRTSELAAENAEIPYMLDNTPEEFARVSRIAAQRHLAEAAARNAPAWVQSVTPAEIVRQRALGWPDFHPEDFCHQCGRRNPCWFADTDVWQTATRSTGDGGGVLCPSCFAELWESVTGKTAIIWRLSIDPRSRDAAPSPAAREARVQAAANQREADTLLGLVQAIVAGDLGELSSVDRRRVLDWLDTRRASALAQPAPGARP